MFRIICRWLDIGFYKLFGIELSVQVWFHIKDCTPYCIFQKTTHISGVEVSPFYAISLQYSIEEVFHEQKKVQLHS